MSTFTSSSTGTVVPEPASRRAGRYLALGAPLFAAGVATEWVLRFQRPDGTVTQPVLFAAGVGVSLVGAALVLAGTWGLRGALPDGRAARWGRRTTVIGAALLTVSVAAVLVTGLVSGTPAGWSFVPFGLGFLLLSVGPLLLAVGTRRRTPGFAAATGAAGVAALATIGIPFDPWHDVSLVATCVAWAVAGVLLRRS